MSEFEAFPKIARLSRKIIVTEKIDGTNAQIHVDEDGTVRAGSRGRWITPEDDNYGFARWVAGNVDDLRKLGVGRHFGEWWGPGIQRGYGVREKRFSLFNTERWPKPEMPACVYVVPVLYKGPMTTAAIDEALAQLDATGSVVSPGYMRPEGIVIFHTAARMYFKKTLEKDEEPKGKAA